MSRQTKYYRSRQSVAPDQEMKPFPWGALTVACLMATFVYIVYGYSTGLLSFTKETPQPPQLSKTAELAPTQPKKAAQRFEFYQLLPDMEVLIDEPIAENPALKPKPLPKTTSTAPAKKTPVQKRMAAAQFLLQAGSFRLPDPAYRLQQRLQTEGLMTKIQKVEAEDGTWYRVTLGPYETESKALQHKKRLGKLHIQGILILQR